MNLELKLLLVDDESYVLEQIRRNVNWDAYHVHLVGCFENAFDALDCIIDEMPDILITDIKMPIVDGLELIYRARRINPNIECVILSGYAEFELAQKAMAQGVQHYLLKPFSRAEFETMINECRVKILQQYNDQTMAFTERTKLVDQLAEELLMIKERSGRIDETELRKTMSRYTDLSILQSALVNLIANSDKEHIDMLPEVMSGNDDLFRRTLIVLERISKNGSVYSDMVQKVKEYTIHHYMDEDLSLQWIAEHIIHYGAKYVGRCFLKEIGCRFSEYLMRVRMDKAISIISQDNSLRLEEVAKSIGMGNDVPYFSQLFKRYTGLTVNEYKKERL